MIIVILRHQNNLDNFRIMLSEAKENHQRLDTFLLLHTFKKNELKVHWEIEVELKLEIYKIQDELIMSSSWADRGYFATASNPIFARMIYALIKDVIKGLDRPRID